MPFSQIIPPSPSPTESKAVLIKKNGAVGINLPEFRLYYKATVINTLWSGKKKKKQKCTPMEKDR